MPQRQTLAEARPTLIAEATGTPGRYRVQIINPGWGSSGYYSEAVLSEAATAKVFPAGLKMYADHPTGTEEADRPERSVRDVWGKLVTDATWDGQALVAEAQVRPDIAPVVDFLSDAVGLSIRALGTYEVGEAAGRQGRIITSLAEAMSVDFVTDAGRGGQILSLVESARNTLLGEATANDTRDALQTEIGEEYGADPDVYAWVRDFDPDATVVYFDISGATEETGTYRQGYTVASDGSVELAGDRVEVTVRTTYVPVTAPDPDAGGTGESHVPVLPAGSTPTNESQGGTMPQIEEARLRQLEEDAGRVTTLETERDTATRERDEAQRQIAERDRRDAARPVIAEAFAGSTVPATTVARVTEALLSADVPAGTDGHLGEAAMRTRATEARAAAEAEIAEALAAAGVGTVRGYGTTPAGESAELTEAEYDRRSGATFGRQTVKGA